MTVNFEQFQANEAVIKNGLPAQCYVDPAFFELENDKLFPNAWMFVGFAHELDMPGDVRPITLAGKPFFLVRGEDDKIAAFHNVCRHRCLQLIDEPKNCGNLIQCPYHSWMYGLDGSLKATPYFLGKDRAATEGFDLSENGLVAVRCETWFDWVFININGNNSGATMDFAEFIAPLQAQMGEIDLQDIVPVATIDFARIKSNWKGLMENFIEPYHVQFVHKSTTNQPLVDHYTVVEKHCLGSACDIADSKSVDDSGTLAVTSRFLTLFPNFVMGTYAPDQLGVHLNTPIDSATTHQRRVIYLHKDNHASEQQISSIKALWHEVHKEDHAICERLQIGRKSSVAAVGGVLSPHWENSVRRFQEMVVEAVSP